eukprot:2337405-Rhodomonas_salina.1
MSSDVEKKDFESACATISASIVTGRAGQKFGTIKDIADACRLPPTPCPCTFRPGFRARSPDAGWMQDSGHRSGAHAGDPYRRDERKGFNGCVHGKVASRIRVRCNYATTNIRTLVTEDAVSMWCML